MEGVLLQRVQECLEETIDLYVSNDFPSLLFIVLCYPATFQTASKAVLFNQFRRLIFHKYKNKCNRSEIDKKKVRKALDILVENGKVNRKYYDEIELEMNCTAYYISGFEKKADYLVDFLERYMAATNAIGFFGEKFIRRAIEYISKSDHSFSHYRVLGRRVNKYNGRYLPRGMQLGVLVKNLKADFFVNFESRNRMEPVLLKNMLVKKAISERAKLELFDGFEVENRSVNGIQSS